MDRRGRDLFLVALTGSAAERETSDVSCREGITVRKASDSDTVTLNRFIVS